MMWEGILAMVALVVIVLIAVVAVVVFDEVTDVPDLIRHLVRGHGGRRSLAARIAELESRLAVTERKLARPA